MDEKSTEMTKYASNIFLATKISYMNEIANLCDKTGANVSSVKRGMSFDSWIGNNFLNSGIGFGGSCFPKDIEAILLLAKEFNYNLDIISSVGLVNKIFYWTKKRNIIKIERITQTINGAIKQGRKKLTAKVSVIAQTIYLLFWLDIPHNILH